MLALRHLLFVLPTHLSTLVQIKIIHHVLLISKSVALLSPVIMSQLPQLGTTNDTIPEISLIIIHLRYTVLHFKSSSFKYRLQCEVFLAFQHIIVFVQRFTLGLALFYYVVNNKQYIDRIILQPLNREQSSVIFISSISGTTGFNLFERLTIALQVKLIYLY